MRRILEVASGREVVAIVGVRRCGKTTILRQLMRELAGRGGPCRDALYVDLEDHRLAMDLDVGLLDRLVLVPMRSIGSLVSLGKLARALGTSPSQVASLMEHVEGSQLVSTVMFFSRSVRELVSAQKPRKVYPVDTGMRNAVVIRSPTDAGWLAESLVHAHLDALGHRLSHWKADRKVDLCAGDEIREREIASLSAFHEVHGNDSAWLVTRGTFEERRERGFRLVLCPLWAFLLGSDPAA